MWYNHSFSESSKITKRTMGVEVGGDEGAGRGVGQNLKRGEAMQYMVGFKKQGGGRVVTPLPTMP